MPTYATLQRSLVCKHKLGALLGSSAVSPTAGGPERGPATGEAICRQKERLDSELYWYQKNPNNRTQYCQSRTF